MSFGLPRVLELLLPCSVVAATGMVACGGNDAPGPGGAMPPGIGSSTDAASGEGGGSSSGGDGAMTSGDSGTGGRTPEDPSDGSTGDAAVEPQCDLEAQAYVLASQNPDHLGLARVVDLADGWAYVAELTCPTGPMGATGLAVTLDGRVWVGLDDGTIAAVAPGSSDCMALALTDGPLGPISLAAANDGGLLAYARDDASLWKIDPDAPSATWLASAGASVGSRGVLLWTDAGPVLYAPAAGGDLDGGAAVGRRFAVDPQTGGLQELPSIGGMTAEQEDGMAISVVEIAARFWLTIADAPSDASWRTSWSLVDPSGEDWLPAYTFADAVHATAAVPCH